MHEIRSDLNYIMIDITSATGQHRLKSRDIVGEDWAKESILLLDACVQVPL